MGFLIWCLFFPICLFALLRKSAPRACSSATGLVFVFIVFLLFSYPFAEHGFAVGALTLLVFGIPFALVCVFVSRLAARAREKEGLVELDAETKKIYEDWLARRRRKGELTSDREDSAPL